MCIYIYIYIYICIYTLHVGVADGEHRDEQAAQEVGEVEVHGQALALVRPAVVRDAQVLRVDEGVLPVVELVLQRALQGLRAALQRVDDEARAQHAAEEHEVLL